MKKTCGSPECVERQREIDAERFAQSGGLPQRYWDASLMDFPEALRNVVVPCIKQDFASERGGMFLTGPPGCGKTHLAAACLHAIRVPDEVRWITVPGLLLKIRGSFHARGEEAETEEALVRKYSEVPVLVLDDLGAEKVSDWSLSSLYCVISSRIDTLRPTIITSNLDLGELNEIDARLASRIGGFVRIRLEGRDRRLDGGRPSGSEQR